jgi:hypothetical protein
MPAPCLQTARVPFTRLRGGDATMRRGSRRNHVAKNARIVLANEHENGYIEVWKTFFE